MGSGGACGGGIFCGGGGFLRGGDFLRGSLGFIPFPFYKGSGYAFVSWHSHHFLSKKPFGVGLLLGTHTWVAVFRVYV